MLYHTRFSVHRRYSMHDLSAEVMRHALHAEAYAQDRRRLPHLGEDVGAHAKVRAVAGLAGPRRNDDAVVSAFLYLCEGYLVVANDVEGERLAARREYLPHVLVEVVGEGIVVVENEDFHMLSTFFIAASLFFISRYSTSGFESCTMPPDVCA